MSDTTISVRPDGPYLVKGSFRILDAEGREFPVEHDQAALCRCGGSTAKPFCDGTHSKTGFDAATRAVQASEGGG